MLVSFSRKDCEMDLKKKAAGRLYRKDTRYTRCVFFEVVAFIKGIQYKALADFSENPWLSCNVFISPLQRPLFGNSEQENNNL
jgi:hypothetical protein